MPEDDSAYLIKRLETEQHFARTSTCAKAAAIHQDMADAYRLRLQGIVDTNRERLIHGSTAAASATLRGVVGNAYLHRAIVKRTSRADPA